MTPATTRSVFRGDFLQIAAESGAARRPPALKSGSTCQQFGMETKAANVKARTRVAKDSTVVTAPMAELGLKPVAARGGATKRPRAPTESKKPPMISALLYFFLSAL
jgi:hypothetical protein